MRPVAAVETCYRWLAPRRRALLLACAALLLVCAAVMAKLNVREDIAVMLPASPELRHSLTLMELAPFSKTVFIELCGQSPAVTAERLVAVAAEVARALPAARFRPVLPGGGEVPRPEHLMRLLPSLADDELLAALEARVAPEAMRRRMADNYAALLGMNGLLAKPFIQADPLGFLEVLPARLKRLSLFAGARLRDGFLLQPDGRALLLMLATEVPVTDAAQSQQLMDDIGAALAPLPPEVAATVLSGHRYALANAGTIKRDLRRVFAVSAAGLLLIFGLFIRSRQVVWIALLPGAVLLVAGAVLAGCYRAVSGITLGFGAVLLGITVDFALHVWFALRHAGQPPGRAVARVARPVLYGAATSAGAFVALAMSDIAGIRQLAVFALAGLLAGLGLALLVLPHLLRPGRGRATAAQGPVPGRWRPVLAAVTALALGAGLWAGSGVGLNRQLRSVGMVPDALARAERHIRDNWGAARDAAVLFAEGETLAQALERNQQVAATLAARLPDSGAASLATLWPPVEAQRANRARWSRFVAAHGAAMAEELTAIGSGYGFSRQAFAPFWRFWRQAPAGLDEEALAGAGLESLLALFHARQGGRHYFLTMLPDTPGLRDLALAGALPPGVSLVSTQLLGTLLGQAIGRDLVLFVAVACGSMFVLLCLLFRHAGFALLAMVPLSCGLAGVLLLLRCSGGDFNLFTVAALPLVIGLGADYGIFMVCKARSGQDHGTARAVLVSGLTTLAGFGALVMARHPALHTLGLTVLVGVGVAIPAALLLVPALYRRVP